MLANLNDRIKIMSMIEEACKTNRMIQWVCRNVLRNIHICRESMSLTNITDEERKVVGYWYNDFINSLPYLRVISDKVQICSIMSLYNGRRVTETVFRGLGAYTSAYLPYEYQDSLKAYHNALNVILSDEVDSDLKNGEIQMLTDMSKLEELFETVIPTYRNQDGQTATLYYEDKDITITLTHNDSSVSDTSQSIFDAALDFVVQFIANAGARHWLVDQMQYADQLSNDEFLKHITQALDTARDFDYITPTKKHSVIAGGGVISYDSSTF